MGDFSQWLARKHFNISDVDESLVVQYLRFRTQYQRPFCSDRPALCRLLGLLRQINVIAPQTIIPPKPLEQIEQDFEHYLLRERGLSQTTVIRHRHKVRRKKTNEAQELASSGSGDCVRPDIQAVISDALNSRRTRENSCPSEARGFRSRVVQAS